MTTKTKSRHSIMVDKYPVPEAWNRLGSLIVLQRPGQRIFYDGLPLYVGQTIIDNRGAGYEGTIQSISISRYFDMPEISCEFCNGTWLVEPSAISIPVIGMDELAKRGDDFFDCLRIGDAIDQDVFDSLASMGPLLIESSDFIQVSGSVGKASTGSKGIADTYITMKRFGGEESPWRYVGHCPRKDDSHLDAGHRTPFGAR